MLYLASYQLLNTHGAAPPLTRGLASEFPTVPPRSPAIARLSSPWPFPCTCTSTYVCMQLSQRARRQIPGMTSSAWDWVKI